MTKIEDIRLSSGDLIKMGLTFPQVEVVILQRVEDFPVGCYRRMVLDSIDGHADALSLN
jgi:hypothetical protein